MIEKCPNCDRAEGFRRIGQDGVYDLYTCSLCGAAAGAGPVLKVVRAAIAKAQTK